MAYGSIKQNKRYGLGRIMSKENETARKVKTEDLDFINKFISDRHSRGTDKKRISQSRGWNLITKYIKLNTELYNNMVKVPIREKEKC